MRIGFDSEFSFRTVPRINGRPEPDLTTGRPEVAPAWHMKMAVNVDSLGRGANLKKRLTTRASSRRSPLPC